MIKFDRCDYLLRVTKELRYFYLSIVPAVAVIWKESTKLPLPKVPHRQKRSSIAPSLKDRFLKNVKCLGPRLARPFLRKLIKHKKGKNSTNI